MDDAAQPESPKPEQSQANEAARELSKLGASKGGIARAEALTPQERSEIARRAVNTRWQRMGKGQVIRRATHEAPLRIKGPDGTSFIDIDCAVLDDGTRVLSERAFSRAIGSKRGGSHWVRQRKLPDGAQLPVYLSANRLKPLIPQDLSLALSEPIIYSGVKGGRANGIDAKWIPEILEVWLEARRQGLLHGRMEDIAAKAEILMRGFAAVGIIALIDEATGYEDYRVKNDLAKILEAFVAKELRPWVRTFPADYYREMYRLKGLPYPPVRANQMPRYFGKLTNDIVYSRLAPGVLNELRRLTPRDEKGRLKAHLHRRLTEDVGHPKLLTHLGAVTALMKMVDAGDWNGLIKLLDRHYPRYTVGPHLFESDEERKQRALPPASNTPT